MLTKIRYNINGIYWAVAVRKNTMYCKMYSQYWNSNIVKIRNIYRKDVNSDGYVIFNKEKYYFNSEELAKLATEELSMSFN